MSISKKPVIGGIIFSNMHEGYIGELTALRSCGSVPFGGRYRMIDFPLSNMVDAKITTVGVITKSNYKSLMDHLGTGRDWDLSRKRGGIVLLPPFAAAGSGMYHGRMEALINARDFIMRSGCDRFVMFDCNYICSVDIQKLADEHENSGADITCVYKKEHLTGGRLTDCIAFDVAQSGRITGVRIDPNTEGNYNNSINVMYVSRDFLLKLIDGAQGRGICHFEREVLQPRIKELKVYGFELRSPVMRVGSMQEYYAANMWLLNREVRNELFYGHPVYTKVRDEMPARYGLNADVSDSMIADGCVIEGCVSNSVLFRGVTVGAGAKVSNCILMQGCCVQDGAQIEGVVCDKDTVITQGRVLVGCATNPLFVPKGGRV